MKARDLLSISTLQDVLTMASTVCTGLSTAIAFAGCKEDAITLVTTCKIEDMPTWLPPTMLPYLVAAAVGITAAKSVISWATGRFFTKTVPVSDTDKIGAVTEAQVQSGIK